MNARQARLPVLLALSLALSVLAVLVGQGPGAATTGLSQQATQLPVPNGGTGARVNAVSCGAPGFCVAVGFYQGATSLQGLIETLSGGSWTASTSPVPPGAPGGGALGGVSCTGTTCVAWGQYVTGPSTSAYMADVLSGGAWTSAAITPPTGGTFPSGGYGADGPITGGGCFGPGACTLVGNYYTAGNAARGWVAAYGSGAWQPALTAVVPTDSTGQSSSLTAVSCGNGLCQAVGQYVSSNGFQSLEVSINPGGAMNSPFAGALPSGGVEGDDGLGGVACDAGGLCTGYGTYYTSGSVGGGASNAESYLAPIGGTAFQPQQPLTPLPPSTTIHPAAGLWGAACAGGDCVVTGNYYDTAGTPHPLIDRFTGGHWVSDPVPGSAYPAPVACGSPSFCVALDTASASQPADVFTGAAWSTLAITDPTGATGASDYSASPVACDSASTCWVVGAYPQGAFADLITTGSVPTPTPTPTPTPSPSPTPGGGSAVTAAQVAAWFHGVLVPGGAAAHLVKILHSHGLTVTVTAGQAGSVQLVWTTVVRSGHKRRTVVIAVGGSAVAGGGSSTIHVLLTAAGKKIFAKAHTLSISTSLVFTPASGAPISVAGHVVLHH